MEVRIMFGRFSGALLIVAVAISATALWCGITYALDPEFNTLVEKKGAPALELLEKPTLSREVKLDALPCSTEDFEFLLDRPRTSVALAGQIHKSLDKYELTLTKSGIYHIDDKQGHLVGDLELVLNQPGRRVYYITGYWKLMPGIRINGRLALDMECKEPPEAKGKALDVKTHGYIAVDSSVAGAAFKTVAFLFPGRVDARINRFGTAVRKVTEAIRDNPEAALKRIERSPNVPDDEAAEFRKRFLKK
jgi:hypothetical protein